MHWMEFRGNVPLVRSLRDQAEQMRSQEVVRALRQLQRGADPKQVIESLSQGLVNKFMHAPTEALSEAPAAERRLMADLIARLFRLPR